MSTSQPSNYRLPSIKTIENAMKLAILEDRPILMDYWVPSLEKKAVVGVRKLSEDEIVDPKITTEKLLVKSEEEYTSPIFKTFKSDKEFIIKTQNSIYIVDSEIPGKTIS